MFSLESDPKNSGTEKIGSLRNSINNPFHISSQNDEWWQILPCFPDILLKFVIKLNQVGQCPGRKLPVTGPYTFSLAGWVLHKFWKYL